jgi:hypothetical protein
LDPLDGGIEVIDLEPQQDAVAIWLACRIAYRPVVMVDLEPVKLHHQYASGEEALVIWAAVAAGEIEELSVPATAELHIGYGDQRLGSRHEAVLNVSLRSMSVGVPESLG